MGSPTRQRTPEHRPAGAGRDGPRPAGPRRDSARPRCAGLVVRPPPGWRSGRPFLRPARPPSRMALIEFARDRERRAAGGVARRTPARRACAEATSGRGRPAPAAQPTAQAVAERPASGALAERDELGPWADIALAGDEQRRPGTNQAAERPDRVAAPPGAPSSPPRASTRSPALTSSASRRPSEMPCAARR